jgi:hypothetical protein
MNERWMMNRNYERTMNNRMIERTNDQNFGSITAEQRLFGRTNGRTIERSDERTNEPWTIGRTIEWSDERTNKLRTGGQTIEERPNAPCASVCLCGSWSGRVWVGEGESCHEMAWGGLRGGPCPSIYSLGGRIRGEDERISGRIRGLVGDKHGFVLYKCN